MKRLPVIAAVPNYNMHEQLTELLPQLTEQGYSDIYVLDDASTDGSRETVDELDLDAHFVPGAINKGAGANRNRVLGELGHDALIHFIDADTTLETERAAEVIRDITPSSPTGFVGGFARTPEGTQNIWNFGPRQCLRNDLLAVLLQDRIGHLIRTDPEKASKLRQRFHGPLADWPDPFSPPERRQVFWNIEQNLVIQKSVLEGLGGFDEGLREHEIQDLAIRMHRKGLPRYFDPSISVQHKAVEVRHYNRQRAMLQAEVAIHRKHGFRNWMMPDGEFKPGL